MLVTLGHTVLSVWKVMLLIRRSEQHAQPDGTTLCVTGNAEVAPFSWMHYIVMNRKDYEALDAAILTHERGHIRLRHSWDVLLVDLLTALQWFNPAMWMLRQDLRAIHEYEADGAVLSQGINARQYQYLLISKATGIGGYSIANGISHSTLKNRITMMLHKKSSRSSLLKLLALLPIVGITLALNARTVTDYVYDEPQKQTPVKIGKKAGTVKMGNQDIEVVVTGSTPDDQETKPVDMPNAMDVNTSEDNVFDVVEQMPEFPGGMQKLLEFLSQNIRYPKEAMEKDIQGRVIVTFVVKKDGSISDATVVRSVDPLLDEEGLRVINAMPNWTPGMQKGEPVNVKYTVPISFKLQGKAKKEDVAQASTLNEAKE
jgi:TonB family protein